MGTYADLAEVFHVLGVHQRGPADLAAVAAAVAARAPQLRAGALPTLVLDDDGRYLFSAFRPKALDDMILLDPLGAVVVSGPDAEGYLRGMLETIRRDLAAGVAALQAAKDPPKAQAALAALLALDLAPATDAADRYAAGCPAAFAPGVFATMARAGRLDAVVAAFRDADAKRRRAAIEVATADPRPEFADGLAAAAGRPKAPADEAAAALGALVACAPNHPDLEVRAIELAKRADTPSRVRGLEFLGRLATPGAKAHLVAVLGADGGKSARVAAATALGRVGGADVVDVLRKVAADDRVPEVRAAAQHALDGISAKDAAKDTSKDTSKDTAKDPAK